MKTFAFDATGGNRLRAFYVLTKPRVNTLIVFCAVIGMFLAVPDGLPNACTVFAATIGIACVAGAAAAIALVRIVLVGFTFGNLSMMLYSLAGAAVSLLLMVVFRRLDWFGVTGVSILGGAGHNIGQLIVAALVVENASLFYYLPVLLAAGTAAGALIGLLGGILVNRLKCLDLTKFM